MLGMAFYEDKGKAVVGLKGPKQKRKEMAREKVRQTLDGNETVGAANMYKSMGILDSKTVV
jgi:hypothetical protein